MPAGDFPQARSCPTCGRCPTCGYGPSVYWPNYRPYYWPYPTYYGGGTGGTYTVAKHTNAAAAAPNNMTYQMVNTAGAN